MERVNHLYNGFANPHGCVLCDYVGDGVLNERHNKCLSDRYLWELYLNCGKEVSICLDGIIRHAFNLDMNIPHQALPREFEKYSAWLYDMNISLRNRGILSYNRRVFAWDFSISMVLYQKHAVSGPLIRKV